MLPSFYIYKMYRSITCVNFLRDLFLLLLLLFLLAYSSPSFHLIAHPHNFLIRFCRKNEKDRNVIAPRLLFFLVCERAQNFSLRHSSATSFLFPSLALSSSSASSSSPPSFQDSYSFTCVRHTNDQ